MAINDLPMLAALRTKMQWHQERQRVLAENISNSDTPNFKPRDLIEPKFDSRGVAAGGAMTQLAMMRTAGLLVARLRAQPTALLAGLLAGAIARRTSWRRGSPASCGIRREVAATTERRRVRRAIERTLGLNRSGRVVTSPSTSTSSRRAARSSAPRIRAVVVAPLMSERINSLMGGP